MTTRLTYALTVEPALARLLDEAAMTPWSAPAYQDLKARLTTLVGSGARRYELRSSDLYEAALLALVEAFLMEVRA